jgi:hypothetical protein
MLTNLPRCTMSLDAETPEQPHHVMIMFRRRISDAEYSVKQVGVGAIEQRLKSPELIAVQSLEGVLSERAEDEVALLRPAMPAPKQEAPAADIRMITICGLRDDMSHHLFSMSLFENRCCDALQCCVCRFISSAAGILLSFRSDMIRSDPTTTRATISTPNASAITLLVWPGEWKETIKRSELIFPQS